jgi:hypothetical protein
LFDTRHFARRNNDVITDRTEGGALSGIHGLDSLLLNYESEGSLNPTADTGADTSERLKTTIEELAGIQSVLVAGELDPRILADFRDAVNRVRNTAWAAYQYAELEITGQDSGA